MQQTQNYHFQHTKYRFSSQSTHTIRRNYRIRRTVLLTVDRNTTQSLYSIRIELYLKTAFAVIGKKPDTTGTVSARTRGRKGVEGDRGKRYKKKRQEEVIRVARPFIPVSQRRGRCSSAPGLSLRYRKLGQRTRRGETSLPR